mgnify:CR=1 FL=1
MAGKAVVCLFGLRFYSAYPYLTHPPLPPIPRLDIDSVRATRAKNGSLRDFYSLLLHVLLHHEHHMLTSILMVALIIQILCAIINVWWKISTHTAAIGGVTGSLIAFSLLFNFNPMWWLCLTLIVSGFVGSSRMILRQHSLEQVASGFFLGIICSFITIIVV